MWRHYVYQHLRADDGTVFYVGKGTVRAKHKTPVYERADDMQSRNRYWVNVANKHGFIVEVVASFKTDADAQEYERQLIAAHGRAALVNMTDGGDGCAGIIMSHEARKKLSEHAKRPRSDAWVSAIRLSRKNGGNGGVVKRGDKLPDEWRASISAAVAGEKNHMFGRTGESHPNSRRVIDRATGEIYPSMTAAAEANQMKVGTLYNMLKGTNRNKTSMEFA